MFHTPGLLILPTKEISDRFRSFIASGVGAPTAVMQAAQSEMIASMIGIGSPVASLHSQFAMAATALGIGAPSATMEGNFAEWTDLLLAAETGGSSTSGWGTYNVRNLYPIAAQTGETGTKIRVTFKSGTTGLTITKATIGYKAASGNPYDFSATPTQITFDGGASGATLGGTGGEKLSDEITFTVDGTSDILIALAFATGNIYTKTGASNGKQGYWKSGASDVDTVDASGYTTGGSSARYGMVKVEVFG